MSDRHRDGAAPPSTYDMAAKLAASMHAERNHAAAGRLVRYLIAATAISGMLLVSAAAALLRSSLSDSDPELARARVPTNADLEKERNAQWLAITKLTSVPTVYTSAPLAKPGAADCSPERRADRPIKPAPAQPPNLPTDDPLLRYFVEQLSGLNIGVQGLTSRTAVAETNIESLKDGNNWRAWLTLIVSALSVTQGFIASAAAIVTLFIKRA